MVPPLRTPVAGSISGEYGGGSTRPASPAWSRSTSRLPRSASGSRRAPGTPPGAGGPTPPHDGGPTQHNRPHPPRRPPPAPRPPPRRRRPHPHPRGDVQDDDRPPPPPPGPPASRSRRNPTV